MFIHCWRCYPVKRQGNGLFMDIHHHNHWLVVWVYQSLKMHLDIFTEESFTIYRIGLISKNVWFAPTSLYKRLCSSLWLMRSRRISEGDNQTCGILLHFLPSNPLHRQSYHTWVGHSSLTPLDTVTCEGEEILKCCLKALTNTVFVLCNDYLHDVVWPSHHRVLHRNV